MKSIFVLLAVVMMACSSGCISREAERQVLLREAEAVRFSQLIDMGQTTREQEQKFIKATVAAWTSFRESLGVKASLNVVEVR
jgi:hypothetical protein